MSGFGIALDAHGGACFHGPGVYLDTRNMCRCDIEIFRDYAKGQTPLVQLFILELLKAFPETKDSSFKKSVAHVVEVLE